MRNWTGVFAWACDSHLDDIPGSQLHVVLSKRREMAHDVVDGNARGESHALLHLLGLKLRSALLLNQDITHVAHVHNLGACSNLGGNQGLDSLCTVQACTGVA